MRSLNELSCLNILLAAIEFEEFRLIVALKEKLVSALTLRRQPTKADVLLELKAMKKVNDTLELVNVKNLETIQILEKRN